MRKSVLVVLLIFVAIACATAHSQTTYTTITDGCGGKNLGYCVTQVTDGSVNDLLTLDTRVTGGGPINRLTISDSANDYPPILSVHGTFSGFVANPNGTRNPYSDVGSFISDDGTVTGTFQFYAYYVGSCSGRGCAGATVGWHYRVLAGSTVETN